MQAWLHAYSVSSLSHFLNRVHFAVQTALKKANITECSLPDPSEIFNSEGIFGNPFQRLEIAHLQLQYCKSNSGMVVSCYMFFLEVNFIYVYTYEVYLYMYLTV